MGVLILKYNLSKYLHNNALIIFLEMFDEKIHHYGYNQLLINHF